MNENCSLLPLRCDATTHRSEGKVLLFMVIETFRDYDMVPINKHVAKSGRRFLDGLRYLDSRFEPSFARCFQPMETDDLRTIQKWVFCRRGLGSSFECPWLQV